MADTVMVAVAATASRYLSITHQPDGIGFKPDGTALWPADQFTYRLVQEGAIRFLNGSPDLIPVPPALTADTILLLQIAGVNTPVTLAQLAAFLGATGGSTPSPDNTLALVLDLGSSLAAF